MVTIYSCLSGFRILLALIYCFSCCSVTSVSADVTLSPFSTTAASVRNHSTPDSALEEKLNELIKDELAASKVAIERLNTYPSDKRTIGLALQLCMEQDPNLFCAWFTQSKQQQQTPPDSASSSVVGAGSANSVGSSASGGAASSIDVGVDRIHGLTCFSERRRVCNRVSTNNRATGGFRPRQTQCRPACPPCRQVGCPSGRGGCENNCYCTCGYIVGNNWTFDANAAYYPCTHLCDGDAKCPNEADESPATCYRYPAYAPPMQFQLFIVLVCIACIGVLCGLPFFVVLKLRQHCCRASAAEAAAAPEAGNAAAAFLPKA